MSTVARISDESGSFDNRHDDVAPLDHRARAAGRETHRKQGQRHRTQITRLGKSGRAARPAGVTVQRCLFFFLVGYLLYNILPRLEDEIVADAVQIQLAIFFFFFFLRGCVGGARCDEH